jgi:hypothetical protein
MSRYAPKTTVSPKMFRHFAVITIGVTACLGMFTNGEEAEHLAKELDAQQRAAAANVSTAVQQRVKPVAKINAQFHDARRTYVPLAGEGDGGGSYGQPMDGSGNGGGEPAGGSALTAQAQGIPLNTPGAADSPKGLPTTRQSSGRQSRPTKRQLEQSEAASAARSG